MAAPNRPPPVAVDVVVWPKLKALVEAAGAPKAGLAAPNSPPLLVVVAPNAVPPVFNPPKPPA